MEIQHRHSIRSESAKSKHSQSGNEEYGGVAGYDFNEQLSSKEKDKRFDEINESDNHKDESKIRNNEEDNLDMDVSNDNNTPVANDNNTPVANKETTSRSDHLCRKRNQQYSSNADRICWIAYIKDDQYVLMHKFNDMYFFEYSKEKLKESFCSWQLNTCKINPGKLLHIYDGKDFDSNIDGQVIAIKYYQNHWRGKVKMNNKNEEINLTGDWVDANFYQVFIEQWTKKQGIWNKDVPGCPKSHDMESSGIKPTVHPSNLKVKYPQGNLQACMLASFASCLHYKGMTKESEKIMRRAHIFL